MIGRTPNCFVIGAGPVATAMAGALRRSGMPVLGLWSRTPQKARSAGAIAGVAAYSTAPPDLILEAEILLLAVRDDAIGEVAELLVRTGLVSTRHVLLHCSGAVSADAAFAAVDGRIGGHGILHPLRAIPDGRAAITELKDTVFGIQGDERGLSAARGLCEALGGRALDLRGEQMAAYHASAVIASNYLVALIDAATRLMTEAGIEGETAREALTALAGGALANIGRKGLPGALTGPIRRGDSDTVARHLEVVAADPELSDIYRALGRHALSMARAVGEADPADLDAISDSLGAPASAAAGVAEKRGRG